MIAHTTPLAHSLDRRGLLAGLAFAAASFGALSFARPARAAGEFRIGYQKGSSSLLVLKSRGLVEETLSPLGFTVTWTEFTSGPPLLEALNAGSLDFGATGAPPPIFAQAAGADLVYALATKASPLTNAILVPKDSPITGAEGLKGQQVAVAKGSSAHALLIKALEQAGLTWDDVEPVYLQPADAKAAFEGGSVGVWSIWDPYYAATELAIDARAIATGETVGVSNRSFYLAARSFATDHADALAAVEAALTQSDAWAGDHPDEVAEMISEQTGMDAAVTRHVEGRRVYGLEPLTAEIIAEQQDLADVFLGLGLIPERIDIAAAVIAPAEPANA